MRRTLTTLLLIVIAILVMTPTVYAGGVDTNFGVNLNETVETPASWIATAAEFRWCGVPFGYFSSTCGTKAIIFEGIDIQMAPDLTGIRNIRDVKLIARSTTGVRREFRVSDEDRKNGIYLVCVSGLSPGEWIFTWEIKSKDKTRTYGVLFIRASKNSSRVTAASIHITVQTANCIGLSKEMAFAYVRGLIPAWATPDPGYLAQQQMLAQITGQLQPQPQPQPAYQPQPQPAPVPAPAVAYDGCVVMNRKAVVKLHYSNFCDEIPFNNCAKPLKRGDYIYFKRDGKRTAKVQITSVTETVVETVVIEGRASRGDMIYMEGK